MVKYIKLFNYFLCLIVDCQWSAWNTEEINGYPRVCQGLDCEEGDEWGNGKRSRTILTEPGQGGNPCSPNGELSLEDCVGHCPST